MKKIILITSFLFNLNSFAIFDVQAMLGYRFADFKGIADTEKPINTFPLTLSAHLHPIPLVPVGFGVEANYIKYDLSSFENGLKSLNGGSISLEALAWLNIPFVAATPYVKIGYNLGMYFADIDYKSIFLEKLVETKIDVVDKFIENPSFPSSTCFTNGLYLVGGIKVPVIPFFSILVEYKMGFPSIEQKGNDEAFKTLATVANFEIPKEIQDKFPSLNLVEKQPFYYQEIRLGVQVAL